MGRRDIPASVPAETSEFFKAEVDAFMRLLKIERPAAWGLVRRLQQVCRAERPDEAGASGPVTEPVEGTRHVAPDPARFPPLGRALER